MLSSADFAPDDIGGAIVPMESINGYHVVHNPDELDEQLWSRFVLESENGNIFQTPEMYEVLLATERYEPVLTAIVRETGEILALMLGISIEEPGIVKKRFSRRIVVMGVPVISREGDRKHLLGRMLGAHNEVARKKKVIFTEIRPLRPIEKISPQFELAGYKYVDHLNIQIDLTSGKEHVWSSLKAKKRQAVRKAIKSGLTAGILTVSDVDDLYALIDETYRRARIPKPPKSLFRSVFTLLQSRGLARVVGVKHESKLIAAVLNLLYNDTIYAWFSAVDRRYSRYHGAELAYWSIIEWGAANDFRLFDFGGAGQSGKKYGVREFKRRMGGQHVESGRLVCPHSFLKTLVAWAGLKGWRAIQWARQLIAVTKTEDVPARKGSTSSAHGGGH